MIFLVPSQFQTFASKYILDKDINPKATNIVTHCHHAVISTQVLQRRNFMLCRDVLPSVIIAQP